MKIGVQLYTLRDSLDKDFEGSLKRIHDIGIRYVEVASMHGKTAAEFKSSLDSHGLTPVGLHVGLDTAGTAEGIEMAQTFGIKYSVVPWLSIDNFPGGWVEVADKLMEAGEAVAKADLSLLYHNHDFEFAVKDGQVGYEVIWEHVEPKIVGAEIDLCWVYVAKNDPVTWLNKLSGHTPLTHFKDWSDAKGDMTEVGSGNLDWDAIIPAAKAAGSQYAIIEHDRPADDFASVETSFKFLTGKGLSA